MVVSRYAVLALTLFSTAALAQAYPQPQVLTQPPNDNSLRAASTAYVDRAVQGFAPIANPAFIGAATIPKLTITGSGSTGDVSGMSVTPATGAAANSLSGLFYNLGAGRITVDATGLMSGLSGANITGKASSTLFVRPAFNYNDGTTLYSSSSDFSTPKTLEVIASKIALSPSDSVTILPKAASLAQALHVVQTGPTSGTVDGPVSLNSFDMTWSSGVNGNYGAPGLIGSGAVLGMNFSMNVGGPNLVGQQFFTLSAGLNHDRSDTSAGDKGAFSAGIHSSATTNGLLDGIVTSVVSDSGSSSPQIAGIEMDMTIIGTGTTQNRLGAVVVNTGTKQGTVADIAYALTTGGPDGRVSGSFKTLLGLYKQNPALPNAMSPDGTIFRSDHALTLKNILDGNNITVTDNILLFPGVVLTGAGKLTTSQIALYGLPPATPTGQVSYGGSTAASSFCGSLAGAAGCVLINANGTQRYIPYY